MPPHEKTAEERSNRLIQQFMGGFDSLINRGRILIMVGRK